MAVYPWHFQFLTMEDITLKVCRVWMIVSEWLCQLLSGDFPAGNLIRRCGLSSVEVYVDMVVCVALAQF